MSEQDFELKTIVRKLFWHQGFSTQLNVKLSAIISKETSRTKAPLEEYTDIDVFGVTITPDFRIRVKIADCKTSPSRVSERLFWVKGVKDFFAADDAYLIRPVDYSHSNRQLASRLNIALLSGKDLAALTNVTVNRSEQAFDKFFFDGVAHKHREQVIDNLDAKLEPLKRYRTSYYWLLEPYRNLQQLIVYLGDFQPGLNAESKPHLTIFLDYVWLYTLAVLRAVQSVAATSIAEINRSTQQYLLGGEINLREKTETIKRIRELRQTIEGKRAASARQIFQVLPPYYDGLLELITRFIQRPQATCNVLRYSEWLNLSKDFVGEPAQLPETLLPIDPISVKLLNDVAVFLTESSGLNKNFSSEFIRLTNKVFNV